MEDWKEALELWNPWWHTGEVPSYLVGKERAITKTISPWMGKKWIKVILGPRRAGKTTVMYQLIKEEIKKRGPQHVAYINLEDPALTELPLSRLLRELEMRMGKGVVFLDEVQEVEGWERVLRTFHDRQAPLQFVVSGSTLAMMNRAFSRALAGRYVSFFVYPLSLLEAVKWRGFSPEEGLPAVMEEALHYGLYPEVFLERRAVVKKKLLLEYLESIVARDVAAAHALDVEKAREIALFLLRNAGSLISVNRLSKTFSVSFTTAERYIQAFTDSMALFEVRRFAFSLRQQRAFPRKLYPIDAGLREVAKGPSPDRGRVLEALVAAELYKAGHLLYYWRNGGECDFVVGHPKPTCVIQVTWAMKGNREREEKGLKEASRKLKAKPLLLSWEDLHSPSMGAWREFLNLLSKE